MLVLSRKLNQAIIIGDDIRIVVVAVDRDQVKLGIDAPRHVPVHRSEVYDEIQRANRKAAEGPEGEAEEAPVTREPSAGIAKLQPRSKKRPPETDR